MPRVELRDYRKARTPFGSLLRLFRYFRHCRTIMICAVASILVYVAATIAASYCMKPLVNLLKQTGLAPSEVYAKYLALLLGLAGLYALSAVTNYLLNRLMLECSTVIMRALRTELFAKMQRLPISYFDANTNGSLMSYFTNDIEATNELLQHAITQMLISVTSLLGTIGMMLALSMKLFSLMVVLAAIVIVVVRGITKKSSRCYRQQQKDAASVNGFVEEMIAGQRDVKVFTHEKQVMQDFEPINESFYQSSAEATTVTSIVGPILNNLSHFFYALTCAVGVLWLTGENAGGVLITFLGYIRTFAERVSQISEQFNAIMLALAGAERIFDVLDMPPEVDEGEVTLEQSGRDYFWVRPDGERVPLRGDVRRRSPLSARPARARPRSRTSSTAFTTFRVGRSPMTASTCATSARTTSAVRSVRFCRTRTCLPARSWRTSGMVVWRPRTRTASAPRRSPTRTTSFRICRRATTPC